MEQAGDIATIGLIQEQHPDRCALFMQWKQMEFPVMVDPLNLLGVRVVPLTLLIDEHGIVRALNPRPPDVRAFVEAPAFDEPEVDVATAGETPTPEEALRRRGDRMALAALTDPQAATPAIALYEGLVARHPDDAWSHFKLGVLYRLRHDSPRRRPKDFARAIEHWSQALALNPNQYIWRRRIQQFGPRLDKPYPFYDWVETARREIAARGETPHPLRVEPRGSELAAPQRDWTGATPRSEPDPQDRIERDTSGLIRIETIVVPATGRPGVARVHVQMTPTGDAHWNNETEPTVVWVRPPEGVEVSERGFATSMPSDSALSTETRTVEFEVRYPPDDPSTVRGYALYFVCEGADAVCRYLRQDFEVFLPALQDKEQPG